MPVLYVVLSGWLLLALYSYAGYPALLILTGVTRRRRPPAPEPTEWPLVSITVPVHNEEDEMDELLQNLLATDYPPERRQILIVSDGSTDTTDAIVRRYAARGVELLSMARRQGKTAAEAAAAAHLRGEIVVNTDACIRLHPAAVKRLAAHFVDPGVGVASGRDVSVARMGQQVNPGESRYVGYEMWVRALETRAGGIVGASGCLYAIRAELHRTPLPEMYSRDFSSALIARTHGYRAISVDDALCYVPRTDSMRVEYWRKVRTITRGLQTLSYHRHLLNAREYGAFSWMLFSHKLCRWITAWYTGEALILLAMLALTYAPVPSLAVLAAVAGLGGAVLRWPTLADRISGLGAGVFLLAGNAAAVHALVRTLAGRQDPMWQPTRRAAPVLDR